MESGDAEKRKRERGMSNSDVNCAMSARGS
jgi:hypothetical protein